MSMQKELWGVKEGFGEGIIKKTKSFVTFFEPAAEIYLEF